MMLVVAGVTLVQRGLISPANFGGADEWLYLDLTSRGELSIPYANRPLVLLWHVLAGRLFTGELAAFAVSTTSYLIATGVLTALLARRLAPGEPLLALLAGAAAATWAPLDHLRLDTVLITGYAGFTFAATASLVAFDESWRRSKPVLLVLAALLGFVAALGVEAVVPVLVIAPLVVLVDGRPSRRLLRWALAWWTIVGLAALVVAAPLLQGTPSYQTGALGIDLRPFGIAIRLGQLLAMQAVPLLAVDLRELQSGWVIVAAVTFAAGALLCADRGASPPAESGRLVRVLGLGLSLALAGHFALALTPRIQTPARTQLLSAPGFGLFLAAAVALGARCLPRRAQSVAAMAVGAWVVAVGTGRVAAMQAEWDSGRNAFPAQRASLLSLTREAPALRPGTLMLLLDDSGTWPYGFSFRHAIRFLYGDDVVGLAPGAEPFLYPNHFVADGVVIEPWPVIRSAWQVEPTLHRWDTIVIAQSGPHGSAEILDRWPEGRLPSLPAGARYAPAERVLTDPVCVARRRVLDFEQAR